MIVYNIYIFIDQKMTLVFHKNICYIFLEEKNQNMYVYFIYQIF